jgi:hypothetical protein
MKLIKFLFIVLVASSLVSCSAWRGMKRDVKRALFNSSRAESLSLQTEQNLRQLEGKFNMVESRTNSMENRLNKVDMTATEAQRNAMHARKVTDEIQQYSGDITVTPLLRK